MSINEIQESARTGNLIVVLGAGASMSLTAGSKTARSWPGLISDALNFAADRSLITDAQKKRHLEALDSNDIDDLLGAAEFVGRKLGSPNGSHYQRWMQSTFSSWTPEDGGMQNALRSLEAAEIPLSTLNYDTLAETATGLEAIELSHTNAAMQWARGEKRGILHLHGVWTEPETCVFGIRDYEQSVTSQTGSLIRQSLSSLNRLLFVGCGDTFGDPNFVSLINWLKTNMGGGYPQHYALVKNSEVKSRLADPTWHGFVEPLGYGDNHSELPAFILKAFPTRTSSTSKVAATKIRRGKSSHTIQIYRDFLMRDCGAMTIEGLRADMDTAQRKFDLERLFVPLELLPVEPEIPLKDKNRRDKLSKWKLENSSPIPFSEVFAKHKRICVLALPGGGKTILLKRLAVAYASASRRRESDDNLPDIDLLPLVIRCREWKDHIRQPIIDMVEKVAAISGETKLVDLAEAFSDSLEQGNVLILVDGLDEIHNASDRAAFVENLERFVSSHPDIRLVVTSRRAGFDLVAPALSRICEKFTVAPLKGETIKALCHNWHVLMDGKSKASEEEARDVAEKLLETPALRRLSENPLLLTMLLVVKHGAGRLPPDRVTLYERAVEVLLDTWNVAGHEPLNVREAVPQIACLSYELMRQGKQTATERQILEILEEARSELPHIRRRATDSVDEFLKRVELRSSLILEGGHVLEGGKTVPFYQYRHLTFQEYLTAVAVVDGHIVSKTKEDTILERLGENVSSSEWKEVVPMVAVLAKSHASKLIEVLHRNAQKELNPDVLAAAPHGELPPAIAALLQCFLEEAQFPQELVGSCAKTVLLGVDVRDGISSRNWLALAQGPYGVDFGNAILEILGDGAVRSPRLRINIAVIESARAAEGFWSSNEHEAALLEQIMDPDPSFSARAILAAGGSMWLGNDKSWVPESDAVFEAVQDKLIGKDDMLCDAAAWTWGFIKHTRKRKGMAQAEIPSSVVEALIASYIPTIGDEGVATAAGAALGTIYDVPPGGLNMKLKQEWRDSIAKELERIAGTDFLPQKRSVVRLGYLFPDDFDPTLVKRILSESRDYERQDLEDMMKHYKLKRKRTRRTKT